MYYFKILPEYGKPVMIDNIKGDDFLYKGEVVTNSIYQVIQERTFNGKMTDHILVRRYKQDVSWEKFCQGATIYYQSLYIEQMVTLANKAISLWLVNTTYDGKAIQSFINRERIDLVPLTYACRFPDPLQYEEFDNRKIIKTPYGYFPIDIAANTLEAASKLEAV